MILTSGIRLRNRWSRSSRRGLSFLQFLGCLIAVAGGIWLGARYTGLDIGKLAYTALDDAELLEAIPEEIRPPCPEGHGCQMSDDEIAAALQSELVALREEISALRQSRSIDGRPAVASPVTPNPTQPTLARTLEFWNHLREIAGDEAALQMGAQAAASEVNADRVFALRGRVSRFAAKAVESVPSDHVDPQLMDFGQQLADWYVRGGKHYDWGAQLWSDRNAQESSAQLTSRWETADHQLRNEAELLRNKAASLRAALMRQYGGEFAEFGG